MPHFDLCLNWYWEYDSDFVHMLETACHVKGISVYKVTPHNLLESIAALYEGQMTVGALFDRGNDDLRFEPVRRFVKKEGIYFINPPEVAFEVEQKDTFHFTLAENGICVPATIILPSFVEQPLIPPADISRLGRPFVIKPAYAGGGAGVETNVFTWERVLWARTMVPAQRYLLQSYVNRRVFEGREAWFRVYYCAGQVYPCWWNTSTHVTEFLTSYEAARLGLAPLYDLTCRIAKLTRLDLFSTEIALTPEDEFVTVDYVNDSIDLRAKSHARDGVPDMVLWFIAYGLADLVAGKKKS